MNTNKRWESGDKIELMKQYASGKSFDDIGKNMDRSPNAIKLRLESIVYDNLIKGKSPVLLSKMLNTDMDTIKQLYYSHKSFKQGRGESVQDVNFELGHNNVQTNNTQEKHINHQHTVYPKNDVHNMIGGEQQLLNKIERENHILQEILKNYQMKRQIKKLYIDGKLDNKNTQIYMKLMKTL